MELRHQGVGELIKKTKYDVDVGFLRGIPTKDRIDDPPAYVDGGGVAQVVGRFHGGPGRFRQWIARGRKVRFEKAW
jgi:hypothetical protein